MKILRIKIMQQYVLPILYWLLFLFNIFLFILLFTDIFKMWYGWGNNLPIGAEELGWMYRTKFNYAFTATMNGVFLLSAILFSLSYRKKRYKFLPLIIAPLAIIFLNYYLSGYF